MSRLGVAEEISELAIGHVRRGMVGTYNKDLARAARVEAFERVSSHVVAVVTKSEDVVALPEDIGAGQADLPRRNYCDTI